MSTGEQTVEQLDTPAVVVQLATVEQNLERMARIAEKHGVKMRPHAKTHKTAELARLQLEHGAVGVTASKVSEAEVLADAGIDDIFIANVIVGPDIKLQRLMRLAQRARMSVGVDSREGAARLNAAAESAGISLAVRLEIDSGLERAGLEPDAAPGMAEHISRLPNLRLDGIFTHFGYQISSTEDEAWRRTSHEREGELMVGVANELRSRGFAVPEVSVGCTPTSPYVAEVDGVTEVRPGIYVFQDASQVRLGRVEEQDCALAVLTTVISRPTPNRAIIDAGSKVFSSDRGYGFTPERGYGIVRGRPELILDRLWEEHGRLRLPADAELFIGDRIEIIPAHVCPVVNLAEQLVCTRGEHVSGRWKVIARAQVA